MEVLFRITLRRPDQSVAWGFKLRGGMDSKGTLTFQKIFPNSIADNCGLKEGDVLVGVGERLTQNMGCSEVFDIIANSGNALEIIVERPEQSKAEIHTERFPLFKESSRATGVFDRERALSDDFARIWSTHQGKRLSSSPPLHLHWKTFHPQSSMLSPRQHNNSDYFDNLNYGSNPDVSVPLRLRDAFDRNPTYVSRELKASSYGEPSLLSAWVQSVDDVDDKFRKVRFTEPPESNLIELASSSSYAPSIDWDFKERFGPISSRNFRNGSQNIGETGNNTMDSLANQIDKIDLEKYFTEKSFGGFALKNQPLPFPSNQWQKSHCSNSTGYDTFPRISEASSRITIQREYKPREYITRIETLPTEPSCFDSNSSEFSTLNARPNVPNTFDEGNFSRTSQFSHFTSEERLQSPTTSKNSKFMTSEQNLRQLPSNESKKLEHLDLEKAGLFAVLDRSITDKLMNWNRPPDPEHSATYKLLKEMEKPDDDEYYG